MVSQEATWRRHRYCCRWLLLCGHQACTPLPAITTGTGPGMVDKEAVEWRRHGDCAGFQISIPMLDDGIQHLQQAALPQHPPEVQPVKPDCCPFHPRPQQLLVPLPVQKTPVATLSLQPEPPKPPQFTGRTAQTAPAPHSLHLPQDPLPSGWSPSVKLACSPKPQTPIGPFPFSPTTGQASPFTQSHP